MHLITNTHLVKKASITRMLGLSAVHELIKELKFTSLTSTSGLRISRHRHHVFGDEFLISNKSGAAIIKIATFDDGHDRLICQYSEGYSSGYVSLLACLIYDILPASARSELTT